MANEDGVTRWQIEETLHFTVQFIVSDEGVLEDFKLTKKWSTPHKKKQWEPSAGFKTIKESAKRKRTKKEFDADESNEVTL